MHDVQTEPPRARVASGSESSFGQGMPGRGEVHAWALDLDAPLPPQLRMRCEEALQPEERARAERFPNALDRRRWARARAVLRVLLGDGLGVAPAAIRFEIDAHGKPRLALVHSRRRMGAQTDLPQSDLRFNMAHSGPVAAYALAVGMEVGVDVEARLRRGDAPARREDAPSRRVDVLAVARRAFGPSIAERLAALDPKQREREFLRLWVRHEAALKCLGMGLAGSQRADTERADTEWADTDRTGAGERPWVGELELWGGAVGAVAAGEAPTRVCNWASDRRPRDVAMPVPVGVRRCHHLVAAPVPFW